MGNLDKIQINNYQTQINEESSVKQDQINLTSPQTKQAHVLRYDNDPNLQNKKSFLNSVPRSPLNKIGLSKDQFTTFNASNNLNFQCQSPNVHTSQANDP